MRRTYKHNKNLSNKNNKSNKNLTNKNNKEDYKYPILPESEPSSPVVSRVITPKIKNRGIKLLVSEKNLKKVEPYTYNFYERKRYSNTLKKIHNPERKYFDKLLNMIPGMKKNIPKVSLNSNGYPIKSAFNINKNSGFIKDVKL